MLITVPINADKLVRIFADKFVRRCNVALADASVRFVSEGIDCGGIRTMTYTDIETACGQYPTQKYSGASPWGVWGAVGTIAGGESQTLP
ncbi:MAG: hypothetical protein LBP87_09150 [Planctomycetaceae bacterium]|jgi:hypothetical protein|nr:hypothetical protein [Planctomycetaceae bacterium]